MNQLNLYIYIYVYIYICIYLNTDRCISGCDRMCMSSMLSIMRLKEENAYVLQCPSCKLIAFPCVSFNHSLSINYSTVDPKKSKQIRPERWSSCQIYDQKYVQPWPFETLLPMSSPVPVVLWVRKWNFNRIESSTT